MDNEYCDIFIEINVFFLIENMIVVSITSNFGNRNQLKHLILLLYLFL